MGGPAGLSGSPVLMWWAFAAGLIGGWAAGYPFGKRMQTAIGHVEAAKALVASPFGPVQAGLFYPETPSNVIPLRRSNHNGAA